MKVVYVHFQAKFNNLPIFLAKEHAIFVTALNVQCKRGLLTRVLYNFRLSVKKSDYPTSGGLAVWPCPAPPNSPVSWAQSSVRTFECKRSSAIGKREAPNIAKIKGPKDETAACAWIAGESNAETTADACTFNRQQRYPMPCWLGL